LSAEAFLKRLDRALQVGDKAKILAMTDKEQWTQQGITEPSVDNLSLPTSPIARDSPLDATDTADSHTLSYTDRDGNSWLLTIVYRSDPKRWFVKLWGTPCRATGIVPRRPAPSASSSSSDRPLRFILRCATPRQ
jgi:hypothetical protein